MSSVLKRSNNIYSVSKDKEPHKIAVKLGDTVNQLLEDCIIPQQTKFEAVSKIWQQILPEELSRHSKIVDITSGQIKVLVSSPVYFYELRLCSSEVLGEINRRCPQVRIKSIKFTVG